MFCFNFYLYIYVMFIYMMFLFIICNIFMFYVFFSLGSRASLSASPNMLSANEMKNIAKVAAANSHQIFRQNRTSLALSIITPQLG